MELTEPAIAREEKPTAVAPSRRSLVSRLSIGHVVMILAGLVAILLNLAFLQTTANTVNVAVAAGPMEAGTVLSASLIESVEVGDAGELASGLLTEEALDGLYGSVLARDIQAGEPIRRSDFRPAGSSLALREYSIEVEAANAVLTVRLEGEVGFTLLRIFLGGGSVPVSATGSAEALPAS